MRAALWWIDEHRVTAALIGFAFTATIAVAIAIASGGGGQPAGAGELSSEIPAMPAAEIEEVLKNPDEDVPDPKAHVEEAPTIKERVEEAERRGEKVEIGGELEKAPKPTRCSNAVGGAVVDVTVSGPGCDAVAKLVASHRAGVGSRPRQVGNFTCTPAPEHLQSTCTRVVDAASVMLSFGPGGRGLTDCGQSPITKDGGLARVRVGGIGCNVARTRIFAAMSAGKPSSIKGMNCTRDTLADVATVSCEGEGDALAFTVPAGT